MDIKNKIPNFVVQTCWKQSPQIKCMVLNNIYV